MAGSLTVFRKELADHLGSKRYLILFTIIILLSSLSAYQGSQYLKNNPNLGFLAIFSGQMFGFSFIQLMVFFGPIIGLSLGFDAINKERTSGSLSTLLSQPIFRDSVINGKFLAGAAALSIMTVSTIGIMIGMAIPLLGFGPTLDGILNIISLTLLTIMYLAFWLSLGLLFSVLTKKTSTSMLASVATWLTCVIVISMLATLIANAVVPITFTPTTTIGNATVPGRQNPQQTSEYRALMEQRFSIQNMILKISPTNLYSEAASAILGVIASSSFIGIDRSTPFRSLTLSQGLAASWANITIIAIGLLVCFIVSYIKFLRMEIRPGG
ncbi:ABC transporter permease [Candidatus Bathyarchaeota archaeon]|nr:ABC transporter permease [Candidatus Bathyarchaeota archaeon]